MPYQVNSPVFFAADIHLSGNSGDTRTDVFLSFLDMVRKSSGDLYILGDLFNYWANNQRIYRRYKPVMEAMGRLTETGKVGFLHGNRDFLMRRKTLIKYGVEFLGEAYDLEIGGKRLFLTHGDVFCLGDETYQRYKSRLWSVIRTLDAFTPGFLADYLAKKFRNKSIKTISKTAAEILALSDPALREQLNRGFDYIVCGHVHREEIRDMGDSKSLIILPPWDREGGYALWTNGEIIISPWPK